MNRLYLFNVDTRSIGLAYKMTRSLTLGILKKKSRSRFWYYSRPMGQRFICLRFLVKCETCSSRNRVEEPYKIDERWGKTCVYSGYQLKELRQQAGSRINTLYNIFESLLKRQKPTLGKRPLRLLPPKTFARSSQPHLIDSLQCRE